MLKKLKTKTINFIPYLLIILTGMNIFNKGSVVLFIFCLYCLFILLYVHQNTITSIIFIKNEYYYMYLHINKKLTSKNTI
jgi:hypothetical protein